MVFEFAEITVQAGREDSFEKGVAEAAPLFLRARGCHGVALHRVVEDRSVYRLVVEWETVDNHLVDFRNSPDFQEWRRLVASYFEAPPKVTHTEVTAVFTANSRA